MNNKLGLSDISYIEEELVDFKSKLLNEYITFNEEDFNLKYLIKLYDFLFGDLYFNTNKLSNRVEDTNKIESIIKEINTMIYNMEDKQIILDRINDLICMQIFDEGNNRTIKIFFQNIIKVCMIKNKEYYEELYNSLEYNKNRGK